jgi:hypothetical protein
VDGGELLGSNAPAQGGSFRFYLDGERWHWSDSVARMHGYQPGEVTPTTELLLSQKHPDDQPQVTALFDKMIHVAEPFSSKHRVTVGRCAVGELGRHLAPIGGNHRGGGRAEWCRSGCARG